jgi:hypothetical protein
VSSSGHRSSIHALDRIADLAQAFAPLLEDAADDRRLEENERARTELAAIIRKMLDAGYSMGDLGRELGTSRQAVYDLLKRAAKGERRGERWSVNGPVSRVRTLDLRLR